LGPAFLSFFLKVNLMEKVSIKFVLGRITVSVSNVELTGYGSQRYLICCFAICIDLFVFSVNHTARKNQVIILVWMLILSGDTEISS